jgi:hypothetical protein
MHFASKDCDLLLVDNLLMGAVARLGTPRDAEALAGILNASLKLGQQFVALATAEGEELPVTVDEVEEAAAELVRAFRAWGFTLECQGG